MTSRSIRWCCYVFVWLVLAVGGCSSGGLDSACGGDKDCVSPYVCVQGRCGCGAGLSFCERSCVNLKTNPNHCGVCGNVCSGGQGCVLGRCGGEPSCPAGQERCGEACIEISRNPLHCGGCGQSCAAGERCEEGKCIAGCAAPLLSCGGGCVDATTDPMHCGGCDKACTQGLVCAQGSCLSACPAQTPTVCAGGCFDLQASGMHCGACGQSCAGGQVCVQGACLGSCPALTPTTCFGGCFDLKTSSQHCGACGQACGDGEQCEGGACRCPEGLAKCADRCVYIQTDPSHCGGCGNACPSGQFCSQGACVAACPAVTPQVCLGGCFDLQRSPQHCGACGNACSRGSSCEEGRCSCASGFARCGESCIDTNRDEKNCGACGISCPVDTFCKDGLCCDSEAPDFCECPKEDLERACYTGSQGTRGIGECRSGTQICEDFGGIASWSACEEQVIPQSEGSTPDGKDNDCDGKIDEGLSAKVTTFAGPPLSFERVADGTGSSARISSVSSMLLDVDGTVFFADGAFLRQMSSSGQVSTLAGDVAGFADGIGKSASMHSPRGLAFLPNRHLVFADRGNHRIRRLERPSNQVVTMAGSGGCQTSSGVNCYRDGDAAQAQFFNPSGVAVDSAGLVYIADTGNHRIRRLDLNNQVTTFAGTGTRGLTDGNGNQAQFNLPTDIVFHTDNSFYLLEAQGRVIRNVTLQGVVSTYMNFNQGFLGFAFRAEGDLFLIASHFLARLDVNQSLLSVAGNTQGRGFLDGEARKAFFMGLSSLAIRPNGGVLLGDSGSRRIRLFSTQDQVTSLAGDAELGWRDGAANQALFHSPTGIVSDGAGGFFVSDTENNLIRRIDAQGNTTTFAGSLERGFAEGQGQEARFDSPQGLVWSAGFLYVADTNNNAIRRIDAQGRVTNFAGSGQSGAFDGQGTEAEFSQPTALAVDSVGRLYVADTGNYLIRRIDTQGNVTTFSGSGDYGQEDGTAQRAEFASPVSLAFSPSGDLYVGENDFQYASLRKISSTGAVTTISKREEANEREIGPVSTVYLSPLGLVFAPNGDLFLSDGRLSVIRKLDPQGQVSLMAGSSFGFLDGPALLSEFGEPAGLALTSQGHLLIADPWNHRIRRFEP